MYYHFLITLSLFILFRRFHFFRKGERFRFLLFAREKQGLLKFKEWKFLLPPQKYLKNSGFEYLTDTSRMYT